MSEILWNQRKRVNFASPPVIGEAEVPCEDNPTPCCPEDPTGLPDPTPQPFGVTLRVERKRWYLPPGAELGETWCIDAPVCCAGVDMDCCGGSIPAVLTAHIHQLVPPCDCINGTYTLVWNGEMWVGTEPISCSGFEWTITLECRDGGSSMELTLTAEGGETRSFGLAITCDPFTATAGFVPVGGILCADSFLSVEVTGAEGIGDSGYFLRVQYQRVYLPAGTTVESAECIPNPACCIDEDVCPDLFSQCPVVPAVWEFEIDPLDAGTGEGFGPCLELDQGPCCAAIGGLWQLVFNDTDGLTPSLCDPDVGCLWGQVRGDCECAGGGIIFPVQTQACLHYHVASGVWRLVFKFKADFDLPFITVVYEMDPNGGTAPWDCLGPNTFTLMEDDGSFCSGWPETITVTPA